MLTLASALRPAIFLHYKITPYILDAFPFLYNTSTKKVEWRVYTQRSRLIYQFCMTLHPIYMLIQLYITAFAPGGLDTKAVAVVIIIVNFIGICLRWELEPDRVPVFFVNRILAGTDGKHAFLLYYF